MTVAGCSPVPAPPDPQVTGDGDGRGERGFAGQGLGIQVDQPGTAPQGVARPDGRLARRLEPEVTAATVSERLYVEEAGVETLRTARA
ncbi:hypothetical protein ACFY5C_10270 [Streptomyces sp. NPDC012935]|uniref:hypothetical protein n=1 Tax=Streptomyces sp. NPDC012935 TaxID=3364857 RepID=UPI0036C99A53